MTCAYGASRQRHRKSSHFRTFVNSRCCSPATLSDFDATTPRIYRVCQRAGSAPSHGAGARSMADLRGHVKHHRARLRPACPACHPFPPWLAATPTIGASAMPSHANHREKKRKSLEPLQNFLRSFFAALQVPITIGNLQPAVIARICKL